MKLGNPKKKSSGIGRIAKKLPDTFDLHDIKRAMPDGFPNDPYAVLSVADVLENEKMVDRESRTRSTVCYKKC